MKNVEFGTRLGALMIGAGFVKSDGSPNATRFARAHGFLAQSVSNWLKGTEAQYEDVRKLAAIFSVELQWMMGGDPEQPASAIAEASQKRTGIRRAEKRHAG